MDGIPGFYGKFPEIGDFVNRRLSKEFVDPWDTWLQEAVATSREQLGKKWLDLYLSSPIWRFVLSKGLCGEQPWFGMVMPSVDRVGRYFPLTIACPLALDCNPIAVAYEGAGWFEIGETVILSGLERGFEIERFDEQVVQLGGLNNLHTAASQTEVGFGTAWQIPMPSADFGLALPTLAHQLLLQRLGDYSLWWGNGSNSVDPSMLVCEGMPLAKDFAAMLSGNWESGSWEKWPVRA